MKTAFSLQEVKVLVEKALGHKITDIGFVVRRNCGDEPIQLVGCSIELVVDHDLTLEKTPYT